MFKKDKKRPPLVLASASTQRVLLLQQLGATADFLCPAFIDETPKLKEYPRFLVRRLAQAKVEKALEQLQNLNEYDEALILAAETVVSVGRTILPKPKDKAEAEACLRLLSGRGHKVHTALCLFVPKGRRLHHKVVETRVRFGHLSHEAIQAYLATEEWRDKAGGYAIQGKAGAFVLRLVGSYSGVMGLPLYETVELLKPYYSLFNRWIEEAV